MLRKRKRYEKYSDSSLPAIFSNLNLPLLQEHVNIASIIQFRQSITYLNEEFPFGVAFGPASSRQECVESAEMVYNRLMLCIPSKICLTFDVLALLAVRKEGDLNEEKLKALIKLFRPDRSGNLMLLDFAKSVDTVYKELRLLRASVANASKVCPFSSLRYSCAMQSPRSIMSTIAAGQGL
jgi:hypothetical protein